MGHLLALAAQGLQAAPSRYDDELGLQSRAFRHTNLASGPQPLKANDEPGLQSRAFRHTNLASGPQPLKANGEPGLQSRAFRHTNQASDPQPLPKRQNGAPAAGENSGALAGTESPAGKAQAEGEAQRT
ncbi:uncharacterized protein HRG_04580 [Hirsutella rhossiliensis]|uniref:Uncharacterized protein n=1 Tax=Hirsutella rhossiliensis TaxID=111463 RepID=A0A9P8N3R5_9HYPO|nr:uncharacterized protein HRG_04580 [Hirsutella rhossiliensis]KAH0964152.1 hypothetical protein HRG_04580 [Hirsutella rhossiliensis]